MRRRAPGWWCSAGRTTPPAPLSRPRTSSGSCAGCRRDTVVLLDEAYVEFVAPEYRIDGPALVGVSQCRCAADLFEGVWAGWFAGRVWVLCPGVGPRAVDDAVAVRDGHHQPGRGGRVLRRGGPIVAAGQIDQRGAARICAGGCVPLACTAPTRTPTSSTCPPAGRPWREVFDGDGPRVRHYADGAVRITVGTRQSTRSVLSALGRARSRAGRR